MTGFDALSHPLALLIFGLTLILPILVGFLTMRRTKNQSDFFIGGRAMNRVVVALSAVSSGRSSWLVLGVSGMAYTLGAGAVWAVAGYTLAEMILFVTVGRRLREETERLNSLTLLDYFESRFRDSRHLIRITGAAIIGIFITAYVAAQLNAGARSLGTAFDIGFPFALALSVLLILIYMVLGGFIAVAYNDVIRAGIMVFGLLIFPAVGLIRIGGPGALAGTLSALDPRMIDPFSLGAGALIGFLGIGLGSPGQPHILVRYMAIDDPRRLTHSAAIGTLWNVLMGLGAVMIGLLGRASIPDVRDLPGGDPEMVYLVLSSAYFGPVLFGLLAGGIFAAILSTADSQLLVVASTFVRDVYEKIWKKGAGIPEPDRLRLSRRVVLMSGLLSMILACFAKDIIFWLVLFAWGGLGASIGTAVIFSLYWKGTTRLGVFAGMITGTAVTLVWRLWLKTPTGIYELIPAFFLSALSILLVSRLTRHPGDETGPDV